LFFNKTLLLLVALTLQYIAHAKQIKPYMFIKEIISNVDFNGKMCFIYENIFINYS